MSGTTTKVVDREYLKQQFKNYDDVLVKPRITDLDNRKVEKVTGYGLSKNDFTDALKEKLEGIGDTELEDVDIDFEHIDDPTFYVFKVNDPFVVDENYLLTNPSQLLVNQDDRYIILIKRNGNHYADVTQNLVDGTRIEVLFNHPTDDELPPNFPPEGFNRSEFEIVFAVFPFVPDDGYCKIDISDGCGTVSIDAVAAGLE